MIISSSVLKKYKKDNDWFQTNIFYITIKLCNETYHLKANQSLNMGLADFGIFLDCVGKDKILYKLSEIENIFFDDHYAVIEFIDGQYWLLSARRKKLEKIVSSVLKSANISPTPKDMSEYVPFVCSNDDLDKKDLLNSARCELRSPQNDYSDASIILESCQGNKIEAIKKFSLIHNIKPSKAKEIIDQITECEPANSFPATPSKRKNVKEKIKENKANAIACCPKCSSTSITYQAKKLSVGRAIVGNAVFGGAGAVMGGLSSKKGYCKCLNCGKVWKI